MAPYCLPIITYITTHSMDSSDHIAILKDWRDQSRTEVTRTLKGLYQIYHTSQEDSESIYSALDVFQRELAQAKEEEQVREWFEYSVVLKKRFQMNVEAPTERERERMRREERQVFNLRQVRYPRELLAGLEEADQRRAKMLYKTFTAHIEGFAPEETMAVYVRGILDELYKAYPMRYNRRGQLKYNDISRAFSSICIRFEKKLSVPAKKLMLEGKITPQEVAHNQQQLYHNAEMRKEIELRQNPELLRLHERFYSFDAEKQKGEGEECRFCRGMSAYCHQMMQTRSADEPMTRFMVCYECKKTWRD